MKEELLNTKISDLDLSLSRFIHRDLIDKLFVDLDKRQINFRPHIWISDDWFSPDGVTGFAIPFYLFDDRLRELEREWIGYVEGEHPQEFSKLLNHECGHAIDHAYFFKDDEMWCEFFGNYKKRYPKSYQYKKYSKNFVQHLGEGYAQSHPEEDWAETFAVWLGKKNNWRSFYMNWPCLSKLEYMDELMLSIRAKKPNIILNKSVDDYKSIDITVGDYLRAKKRRLKKMNLKKVSIKHLPIQIVRKEEGIELKELINLYNKQLEKKVAKKLGVRQYRLKEAVNNLKVISKEQGLTINKKVTSKRDMIKLLEECYISHSVKFFNSQSHRVIM